MTENPLRKLEAFGQSIWLDFEKFVKPFDSLLKSLEVKRLDALSEPAP